MKTYIGTANGKTYRYFYDPHIRFWTIYQIDREGNQIADADYCPDRETLLIRYLLTKINVES